MLVAGFIGSALVGPAFAYLDPPARYDHPNKNALVKWTTREEIYRICSRHGEQPVGCALIAQHGKRCFVLVTHTFDDARLLRHEIAHCNGWPADHPP